jgi:hypothetical protein
VGQDRAAEHEGEPRVALEHGHLGGLHGPDGHVSDQVSHGGLLDAALAQRRQHLRDVMQEGGVRPDYQHAGAPQPVRVGIEQVRGAMQTDRRLAGAGRALHGERGIQIGTHQLVLIRLDGGHDVSHRPDAGTLDLFAQDLRRQAEPLAQVQVLVLVGRQPADGVEAEPTAQADAHPVGGRGAVEAARDRSPPVDDDRLVVAVADMPTSDV